MPSDMHMYGHCPTQPTGPQPLRCSHVTAPSVTGRHHLHAPQENPTGRLLSCRFQFAKILLRMLASILGLVQNVLSLADTQCYLSFRCTAQWFDDGHHMCGCHTTLSRTLFPMLRLSLLGLTRFAPGSLVFPLPFTLSAHPSGPECFHAVSGL